MTHDDSSLRRQTANRQNAQLSTGPRTDAGKARSSLNAVKTGLTGRTVLLPADDVARYEVHVKEWTREYKPVGPRESSLVQAIADSHWRAERITRLEFALYAQGRDQFAEQFASTADPALQSQLIEVQTFLAYEKQLRNLSIQEARLRRQRDKDAKELRQLQHERRAADARLPGPQRLEKAARMYAAAQEAGEPFDREAYGFEFSIRQIEGRLAFMRLSRSQERFLEPGSHPDAA